MSLDMCCEVTLTGLKSHAGWMEVVACVSGEPGMGGPVGDGLAGERRGGDPEDVIAAAASSACPP